MSANEPAMQQGADAKVGRTSSYHRLHARLLRPIRRWWRLQRRRWSDRRVAFIYSEGYEHSLAGVPMDRLRGEKVLAFLTEEGLVDRDDISVPRQPSLRNLLRAHTAEYLEALQDPEALTRILGVSVSDHEAEQILELQRLVVGGTIQATRLALQLRGVAVNLGGGFHHAHRDSGQAFCSFNDVAVAVARLRARGFKEPILIVDLDIHDGNGTRAIFAHDPTVYTFSVHNEHWGETTATGSTAIALGEGVSDEVYLGTLLKTLPEVVSQFRPGLVIYLAGADPAADDRLGNWEITAKGMLARDQFVIELVRRHRRSMPIVILLAGGYGDRAWRYPARLMSWLLTGTLIKPPTNEELTLMRFRRIKAKLDPNTLTSEPGDFSWRLTDEDLAGILPGVPRQTRFLGYFSRHGVELVLEQFSILDQLRIRGFRHPCVEVDLAHPLGQTLRIFGSAARDELLVELRVDRSHRVIPECEVIIVEWLLLQNPRAEFGPFRRPLPGQNHPGLGMLREVLGWLVVVCEMLELDGIYYVPSSYHVAAQSRQLVRFLKPGHEAQFRVLREMLAEHPLPEASRLMAERGIQDPASGGALEWEGFPMVLPVSDVLKAKVFGEAYEAAVQTELDRVKNGAATPTPHS